MSISGAKSGRFNLTFRAIAAFVCFCFLQEIILEDIFRFSSSYASAKVNLPPNLVMPSVSFLLPHSKLFTSIPHHPWI